MKNSDKLLYAKVFMYASRNSIQETTTDDFLFIVDGNTKEELLKEIEKESRFCRENDDWYMEVFKNNGTGEQIV